MQFRPVTASVVLLSLIAQTALQGYQAPPQGPKISIAIVEGEGAVNNMRQRVAREPMVQVTDENRKPVAGAAVVFLLPNQGAGATFANGARSLTVLTDQNGNAVARGMQANRVSGQYQVRVTASHQGQTASTSINMSNVALAGAAASSAALKWLLILGAAGGAAAGVAVATGGGGSSGPAPRPPTTVSPGTPTVGAPR